MKSYEAFDLRLALLETARFQDFDNDYVVSGCAYIYEQVFGLSITLLKRLLEYEGATLAASGSPRAILKESYHIYDNKLAQDLIQRILNVYIPAFCQLRDGLMERYGELLMAPDDQFV